MIGKVICASALATSSVLVFAQDASRGASGDMFLKFPEEYRCTVTPGADWHAINTKGTGGNSARSAQRPAPSRIDLEFTASPPATAGAAPTVSGHAINTKGTGANSGRQADTAGSTATVSCAASGNDAAQRVSGNFWEKMPPGRRAAGWSCSTVESGTDTRFVIGLPAPSAPGAAAGRSEWSWGTSNSSGTGHRGSIVPRGTRVAGAIIVACSSNALQGKGGYDLAVLKRGFVNDSSLLRVRQ